MIDQSSVLTSNVKNNNNINPGNNLDYSKIIRDRVTAGGGPESSILSDWDDLDGQSGSNYQHNYFYSKKKKKNAGARKSK